ncbi:hypothetical protein RN001_000773 [Aquatica leii]|uniref:SWIM-type domain-containing protein n=1 Tax=Aquatica leii TaxID=1421715 RepID=A0AAN7PFC7_9COLE|nr:hypothetical protein RN001_000773 [Aquatica leii]
MSHLVKLSQITLFFNNEPKLLERGENALESNHVCTVILDKELKIIKGTILASMRKKTYQVEVLFDDTWHISSASCECPRGQVRCHHMATLLLFGHYNYSSTDISCKWSAPKGSQGHDVKTMNDLYPISKAYQATTCVLSDSVVEEFKNKLSVFEGAIGFGWPPVTRKAIKSDLIPAAQLTEVMNVQGIENSSPEVAQAGPSEAKSSHLSAPKPLIKTKSCSPDGLVDTNAISKKR